MLGTSLLLVTATPVFASYNGACQNDGNNEHIYLYRDQSYYPGELFTGARGEVYVGYYQACTGGDQVGENVDIIATVDGHDFSGNGKYDIAQCGLGQITGEGTHFWYTPNSDGHWGRFPGAPTPHFGDHYKCIVKAETFGVYKAWNYTLHDYSDGTDYVVQSDRHVSGTHQAWWGFEVNDSGDEMGGHAGTGGHDAIVQPGYWYTGGSGLHYLTGDGNGDIAFHFGWFVSGWHYKAFQNNGYSQIEAWTDPDTH